MEKWNELGLSGWEWRRGEIEGRGSITSDEYVESKPAGQLSFSFFFFLFFSLFFFFFFGDGDNSHLASSSAF